jgi:tRNA (cytidine/uridine-2'-O-)-methyltransferase
MLLALFEPDIAANTGSLIRLSACLGVDLHVIEPCGFVFDDKKLARAAMDYRDLARLTRHASWEGFLEAKGGRRLVLLTTRGALPYTQFAFRDGDILLLGRESAGVPEHVHARADASLIIPMQKDARSLNVALAAAMALGEALRQTGKP